MITAFAFLAIVIAAYVAGFLINHVSARLYWRHNDWCPVCERFEDE